jgi:hypothetical protein
MFIKTFKSFIFSIQKLYITLQRYLEKLRVSKVLDFFLVGQAENPTFRADFCKKRQVKTCC